MRAQPIPRSGVPLAPGAVEARDLAAPTSSNAAGRFYVAAVVAWTIGGTGQDTAGAAAAGFASWSSSSSSRGGGGRGIVVVAVCGKRRHIVVSCIQKTGRRSGGSRVAGRWSQAGRMNAPSFGPRPQKDRLDKRIRSVLGGYRARPDRHTKLEASRERVRRGPRDKKVDVCATNIAHVDSDSASRPLSSGWPAQPSAWPRAACDALGDGGTAGHVLF